MQKIISQLMTVAKLATGAYTPFLQAYWSEAEYNDIDAWRRGDDFIEAQAALEQKIADSAGLGFSAVAVNLGRAAIRLTLESAGLPENSEVLVPTFCCRGVIEPVLQAGFRPVLVDVDDQLNIRLDSAIEADSPAVRAVIVAHLSGIWARDTDAIIDWARRRNILVIEDAAQAMGLRRNGQLAGTFGDVGIFSTGTGKPTFGPGGGVLITRDVQLVRRARQSNAQAEQRASITQRISDFVRRFAAGYGAGGRARLLSRFDEEFPASSSLPAGTIFRMSGIEARLALHQLQKLDSILEGRRNNAAFWQSTCAVLDIDLRFAKATDNIFLKHWVHIEQKNLFARCLWECGVDTESLYTPLHLRKPFDACRRAEMPGSEKLWRNVISLPVRPNLSDIDRSRIVSALRKWRDLTAGTKPLPRPALYDATS